MFSVNNASIPHGNAIAFASLSKTPKSVWNLFWYAVNCGHFVSAELLPLF
jgi:hypothetical protein